MDAEAVALCLFCSHFVNFREKCSNANRLVPHHPTPDLLTESSRTCSLCHVIAKPWELSTLGGKSTILTGSVSEESSIITESNLWSVEVRILDSRQMPSGAFWTYAEVYYFEPNEADRALKGRLSLITCRIGADAISDQPIWKSLTTTVDDKVTAIQAWFEECRSGAASIHQDCQPVPFTPPRLISVGLGGTTPRLVQLSHDERVEYTALSYCWGRTPQIRTTRFTLPMFSNEIAIDRLPKSMSDAIHITRALGIPYIWIDALCIVQDDSEEWQTVAARMDSIYLGSQLTIAAAQAANSFSGCLNSDPLQDGVHLYEHDMFFSTPSLSGTDEQILVRVYGNDLRSRTQIDTPLSERGWTLQEQLLSHRTAFCMRPEVYWGCQASYRSQCGLHLTADEMARGETTLPLMRRSAATPLRSKDWYRVSEMYSCRNFTFTEDRLPAIAGITRYFADRMQKRPILGLWEETFSHDLAWLRASRHIKPQFASLSESLPSWSWLACPSSIYYTLNWDAGDRVDHIKLVEWDVKWNGKPYSSAVTSAYARIDGPVCEIPIRSTGTAFGSPLQLFGENVASVDTGGEPRPIPRQCFGHFDCMNAGDIDPRTFLCLLISSEMQSKAEGGIYVDEMFLILDSVGDPQHGKYRRVGLGWITGAVGRTFDTSKTMSLVLV